MRYGLQAYDLFSIMMDIRLTGKEKMKLEILVKGEFKCGSVDNRSKRRTQRFAPPSLLRAEGAKSNANYEEFFLFPDASQRAES